MSALRIFSLIIFSVAFCGAQNESLTIGPGDVLHISVLEAADLEQHVRVSDSGDAPLTLGGNVKLLGLSPEEAAKSIEKRLVDGDYLLNPHVNVSIEHFATKSVSVVGQVRAPGSYEIWTPRTILDVVALGGGLTDLADRRITIERRDTKHQIQYFLSNNSTDALKDQPLVYPGDTILVPRAAFVYLIGDFARPGAYPAATNDSHLTVLEGVALAGGTPPNAAPSKALLIRRMQDGTYVEISLNISAMQKGKRSDFAMRENDIVYLPFSYLRNMAVNINTLIAAAASASIYRF